MTDKYHIFKVKDNTDNNHQEMPIFDLPFKLLVNGKSQLSGKTSLVLNLLMNPDFGYDKKFKGENMYIVSDNKLDNKLKILMDFHDIPKENHFPYNEDVLEALYGNLEDDFLEEMEDDGRAQNRLIIMDDVGYSGNLKNKDFGMISKLVANGRHLNLSQIYTSQRFSMVSTTLRSNLTGAILFNTSMKEAELICEDMNHFETKKKFMEMFRRETEVPRSFLVINYTNKDGMYMNGKFETIQE